MNMHWPLLESGIIILTIPGAPIAKGRPKVSSRGRFPRVYTPAKTRRYEDLIKIAAAEVMQDCPPIEGALLLTVTAYVQMPKSLSKKARAEAMDGIRKPVTRPDADNYAKAALDGCNGVLFRDDSQVTDLIVRKRYSERPRLVITLELDAQ
jgi:Holliday junction resolvase RusA-like endonuclease